MPDNPNATTNTTTPTTQPAQSPAADTPPAQSGAANPDAIVSALMAALETRQQRVERSVTRDMATQYGMTEAELTALLEHHRAEKARQLPPEAQQQIDAANARVQALMMHAEVSRLGAAMGLVDADAAIALMDRTKVQTQGDAITGVQEALDALKTAKPYLFGKAAIPQAWGQPQGQAGDDTEAAFRKALGLDSKK